MTHIAPPPPRSTRTTSSLPCKLSKGRRRRSQRIGMYGPGGIGKTTLAALLSRIGKRLLFVDLDAGSDHLDVDRIESVSTWDDLCAVLKNNTAWHDVDVAVMDSLTVAQDMCAKSILRRENVSSLEHACGGYGKGYRVLYDQMLTLLDELDKHIDAGRDVVLIMHEQTAKVPNPAGEDFLRYEPNLYRSDKVSIRHRVKEWLDHLLFVGYDVFAKDGKAVGSGTRTIYPNELPMHWAKSRKLSEPVPFASADDFTIWQHLFTP